MSLHGKTSYIIPFALLIPLTPNPSKKGMDFENRQV